MESWLDHVEHDYYRLLFTNLHCSKSKSLFRKRAELQTTKHAASCSGRLAATCLCRRSSQARFTLKARCTGVRFASHDLLAILPSVVVSARGYETYVHRKGCTEPTTCLISQYPLCKNLYMKLTIDAQRINAHTICTLCVHRDTPIV